MAAIEKIRKRSKLLIVIIGVALLAFVLEDLFQSMGRNRENIIAVVDGDKIPYQDFENQLNKALDNYKSNGTNVTTEQSYNIRNNTLEQMIQENIMTKEYEATGITVSPEELYDQFTGENPHQWVAQSFPGADGGVDREMVNQYLENLNNLPFEYRSRWLDFERAIKQDRLQNKYNNLLKASYFVPTKLAEKYYENKNTKASADVVALRYTTIADSTVVVSDKDTKAFYEENKFRYETDARRDIDYVVFEVKPSLEDRQNVLNNVRESKEEFANVENVVNYVNANSDKHYDSAWVGRSQVAQQIEAPIFDEGNGVGFVFGPFEDEDAFNLVRIVDMQSRPDSLRASHILISYAGAANSEATITKDEAKAKADSLFAVLKGSKDDELFAQLAKDFSTCPSKDKGGDLDWFTDGTMVFPFNEYVVNNPVGAMNVIETVFGYHIVKVTDKTAAQPKVRLAYFQNKIESSAATYQNVLAEASKFAAENKTIDQFNATIEEQGLTKRTMPRMNTSTYQIPGIENPREIVRWAFDSKTKLNDVNSFFNLGNDLFVVAALTNIVDEGYAPMSIVAEQAKYQILNKVKGQMAVDKMKACGDDVNRMVSELGAESTTVSDITIDSRVLGNFGVESDIVGTVLGMKEGEQVGPVAGNSSAFIIKNVKIAEPEATDDYSSILREKTSQFNNKILGGSVYSALRNKVEVKDNREMFY